MKKIYYLLLLMFCSSAQAYTQCGKFKLLAGSDGITRINGDVVGTQKITYFGQKEDYDNMKIDMTLMPASDGNMYGFEYIRRDGKVWLNVELLRNRIDAPRVFGTFDCVKIKD